MATTIAYVLVMTLFGVGKVQDSNLYTYKQCHDLARNARVVQMTDGTTRYIMHARCVFVQNT